MMNGFWAGFEKRAGIGDVIKDFFVSRSTREEASSAVKHFNEAAEGTKHLIGSGEKLVSSGKDLIELAKNKLHEGKLQKALAGSAVGLAGIYGLSKLLSLPMAKAKYNYYNSQNQLARLQQEELMRQAYLSDMEFRQRSRETGSKK